MLAIALWRRGSQHAPPRLFTQKVTEFRFKPSCVLDL